MSQLSPSPVVWRPLEWMLNNSSHPVLLVGLTVFLPLIIVFSVSGALYPANVPPWSDNPIEITGLFLMISILPAYLAMCFTASLRMSWQTHSQISACLSSRAEHESLRSRWLSWWPLGIVFGLINASVNTNWGSLNFDIAAPQAAVSYGIATGQFIMWIIVGLILFFAVQEALALNHLGKKVEINLYNLDRLNGFGQNALNNFLMIAGALALTTLQALDQEFRWLNYRNGLIVGIPAALILVPLPIWNVHRRIMSAKMQLVGELNALIEQHSTALGDDELEKLNRLLVRREQIQNLRNWPMSISIATRFLLYAFIVPMAWAGAAMVEFLLDSILPA